MRYFILSIFFLSILFADKKVIIKVEGMHCPLCTTAVKKSLQSIEGVKQVKVLLNTKEASVLIEDSVSEEILLKGVATTGYKGEIIYRGDK